MKLRIRSLESKETVKIETPTPSTLQHLKHAIAQNIKSSTTTTTAEEALHVSLNRKDELIASPNESLNSLGITSGDLIFYTLNPRAFFQTPNMEPNQTRILPQQQQQKMTLGQEEEEQNMAVDQEEKEEQNMSLDQEEEDVETSPFPCFLNKVYKEAGVVTENNLFILSLHAVLLESGFIAFDSIQHKKTSGFCTTNSTLQYTIPPLITSDEAETVGFKFENMGNFMYVYGFLAHNLGNSYRLCFDRTRFGPSLTFASNNRDYNTTPSVSLHVKEVFEFWKIVKDGLALPLLIDLCEITGLSLPPCFKCLPTDLKLKILELIPGVDLAKIACVSSELRYLSSGDNLWKKRVMEEFTLAVVGEPQIDNWKKEFVRKLRARSRGPRLRMTSRGRIVPNFTPLRRGRFPYGPYGLPGIIGGDDSFPQPFGSTSQGFGLPARRNFTPHCEFDGFDI